MSVFAYGTITGVIQYILGSHYILFLVFLILNVIDCLASVLAATKTKTYQSKYLITGLVRKLGYWLLIAVAFLLSSTVKSIGETINADLSVALLIGWVTLSMLIFNEIRSVLVHLKDLGIYIPPAIYKVLQIADKELESASDGLFIVNEKDPKKDVYRLDLNCDPSELAKKDVITLVVKHD